MICVFKFYNIPVYDIAFAVFKVNGIPRNF